MKLHLSSGPVAEIDCDLLIAPVFEFDEEEPPSDWAPVEAGWGDGIRQRIDAGEFRGREDDRVLLYGKEEGAKRLLLLGLGPADERSGEALRRTVARGLDGVRKAWAERLALLPPVGFEGDTRTLRALVEGIDYTTYRFVSHKTAPEEGWAPESLTVHADDPGLEQVLGEVRAVLDGVRTARDMANEPGNRGTPTIFAERAWAVAKKAGLEVEVFRTEDLEEMKMGAFLSVAKGSEEPPALIRLEHDPGIAGAPSIVLVGKGVTFDSGGISIKPSKGMEAMKYDKSGAAAVLGTMQIVGELDLPLRVVGLIGATENLPSGRANKPGDVIESRAGTTIEIISTDAEGRLVLADCLAYARDFNPALVVDLATLTGACVVGLGKWRAGLFSNDEAMADRLLEASDRSGERIWPMPLDDDYATQLKSPHADVKNTGGRDGGAITAAKFLEKFVDFPWCHLDIAGVAWDPRNKDYLGKGATGFGVRLLAELLINWE